MASSAHFLHLTDAHLSFAGMEFNRDDHKVTIPAIETETRESGLDLLLSRLSERLGAEGKNLDGVLFTGDAQVQGRPGGHELVLELLLRHLGKNGVSCANIVAVPGNHDVPRGSQPSSLERYKDFTAVWRKSGCVTPWLDGIDQSASDGGPHRLVASDASWAVFPINSSNWSQVTSILPEPLASVWNEIPRLSANGDTQKEDRLRSQLDALSRYDMARVSSRQLETLRSVVESTPQPTNGHQLRIGVLHHHLRAPTLREELKPFADVSNLEQLRAFLRHRKVAVVLHGHKHEHAAQFEHVYDHGEDDGYRTLVISGSTFAAENDSDAARLITINGMPNNPSIQIERLAVPRSGVDQVELPIIRRRIWPVATAAGAPKVVQGTDLDEVYARACEVAGEECANGMLIVHLDLPSNSTETLPLPKNYPLPEPMTDQQRKKWLDELVAWWQLERSGLEHRMPFVHGGRLRRYGGKINQIDRIIKLLAQKPSTRALAVLVDPFRDFTADGTGEEFASFCMVEFKRRDLGSGTHVVDAIAFYRAQEFARWWPINVAELRMLQSEICDALGFVPGRITTIAADARTHSRSPTQVAMPIVDRWLDQAPEKLHLLANTFLQAEDRDEAQLEVIEDWRRSLADLEVAATRYNPDGLPIAIEGFKVLASYLEIGMRTGDGNRGELVRLLQTLARANEAFEHGSRLKQDFDRWAPTALELVKELKAKTVGSAG